MSVFFLGFTTPVNFTHRTWIQEVGSLGHFPGAVTASYAPGPLVEIPPGAVKMWTKLVDSRCFHSEQRRLLGCSFFFKEDMLGRISGGVSPDQATNLLDNALTSSDSGVILGALGAISSVPVAACRH